MTKDDALRRTAAALAALAAVEISKARRALVELGYVGDQIDRAMLNLKADLDLWRSRTLADFAAWMDRPPRINVTPDVHTERMQ